MKHMRDALRHASFIGFTGTSIELTDKNIGAVFGDYIIAYDIERATSWSGYVRVGISTLGAAAFAVREAHDPAAI